MPRVILHADDLGVSEGTNEAIIDSHIRGVLTSTSIVATTPAFTDATRRLLEAPELDVGAHLSLNLGRPVAPIDEVGLLTNRDGLLLPSFARHLRRSQDPAYLRQVSIEVEAQLERMHDADLQLSHADSQQHVHMIPGIRDVIAERVAATGIRHLRHSVEPWRGHPDIGRPTNLLKCATVAMFAACRPRHAPKPDKRVRFVGLRHTGQMTEHRLIHYLENLGPGSWEIVMHPGTGDFDGHHDVNPTIADYLRLPERLMEWEVLTSSRVRRCIAEAGLSTIRFADL